MLALPQTIIDLPSFEWFAQQDCAAFDPGEQVLQFLDTVRIVENRNGPGVADFRHELQCCGEVFIEAEPEETGNFSGVTRHAKGVV